MVAVLFRRHGPVQVCSGKTPRVSVRSLSRKGVTVPTEATRVRRRKRLPREVRRTQIVDAVLETVADHGIAGATTARFAAAADVSEGTLYVYFPSREDMLKAALECIFVRMAELIDAPTQTNALEILRDIARRHSEVMKTEREKFTSPWIEFVAAGPQAGLRDAIAQTQTKAFEKMLAIVERGQADVTIRADMDPRRLTWQFYTVMWAENISSLMGLNEYIDSGHSAYSIDLLVRDASTGA